MVATLTKPLTINVSDVSGQKAFKARRIDPEGTVGELVDGLVPRLDLVGQVAGIPLPYTARLDREGRHLNRSERIGDALQQEDRIVLAPSIDAG